MKMAEAQKKSKILHKIIDHFLLMDWEYYRELFGDSDTAEAWKANIEQTERGLIIHPFHIFALRIKDKKTKEFLKGVLNADPAPSQEVINIAEDMLNAKHKAQAIVNLSILSNLVKILELFSDDVVAVEVIEKDDDYALRLRTNNMDVVLTPLNRKKINLKWLEGDADEKENKDDGE